MGSRDVCAKLWLETPKGRDCLEDVGVDQRMIKLLLKLGDSVWTKFMWLRMGTGCELLWKLNKRQGDLTSWATVSFSGRNMTDGVGRVTKICENFIFENPNRNCAVSCLHKNGLELLTDLAPAVYSRGALLRVEVLGVVVGRLVLWFQGSLCWLIITRVPGFCKRTSWFQGILGGGDNGWGVATPGMWCRTTCLWTVTVIIDVQRRWYITTINLMSRWPYCTRHFRQTNTPSYA
jgi:hypothetical protein